MIDVLGCYERYDDRDELDVQSTTENVVGNEGAVRDGEGGGRQQQQAQRMLVVGARLGPTFQTPAKHRP